MLLVMVTVNGDFDCCRSEIVLSDGSETENLINEKADCKEESRRAGTLGRLLHSQVINQDLLRTTLLTSRLSIMAALYHSVHGEKGWNFNAGFL